MRVRMWTLVAAAALTGRALAQAPAPPASTAPTPPPAVAPAAPAQPPVANAPAISQAAAPAASTPAAPAATTPATAVKPAAVVNGEQITLAEVDAALGPPPPTPLTESQRRQMRLEIVGELIDDLLMQQFLLKNAPPVAPADVDQELAQLAARLKEQKADATLETFYHESGMTAAQVRTNIAKMLQWHHYLDAHMNEAGLKTYFEQNKDFFDRVSVQASHIVLRVAPNAPDAEKQAVRKKLLEIREEIIAKKITFAEAAKKYSQCSTAPKGGDVGYFARKWVLDEAFAKAAFGLKVGDISDVVQTEYGMHLILVTDRKPGQPTEYDKVKEIVRDSYAEEVRQDLLAKERKAAKIQMNIP